MNADKIEQGLKTSHSGTFWIDANDPSNIVVTGQTSIECGYNMPRAIST
jgi:hypothetical protein